MPTCPLTGQECDCPILCDARRWPDLRTQIVEFNRQRAASLGGQQINPDGEPALMGERPKPGRVSFRAANQMGEA